MCRGDRLVADFTAGTDARPELPEELDEHLTSTTEGLWVVWAHKLARPEGNLFIPITGGPGYPADAKAECRRRSLRGSHDVPDPGCTCGFHALSNPSLPRLPVRHFTTLAVALSGRVLAFEWAGDGVLWRAERQTVIRTEQPPVLSDWDDWGLSGPRHPGDPDGRPAVVPAVRPRDSGPVRLELPVDPLVVACHDDAGWCAGASPLAYSRAAALVMA